MAAVTKTFLVGISAPQGVTDLPAAVNASDAVIKSQFDTLATAVSGLDTDVTAIQGDVTTLQGDVSTIQGDLTTVGGDVTTLQGDVSTLQGDVTTLQGDVSTLQGDVSTAQTDISNLETAVAAIKAPFKATYAYDAPVWSTNAGVATLSLNNTIHGLGTSRMSNFSIVLTQASGGIAADTLITDVGTVTLASNGTVNFSIPAALLVNTFSVAVAVFA